MKLMSNLIALANTALLYLPALLLAGIGVFFAEIRFDYGVLHEGFDPSRLSVQYAYIVGICVLPAAAWPALIKGTSRLLCQKRTASRRPNQDGK